MKNSGRAKTAFGAKKIESSTPPSRILTLGKKKTDKENNSANQPTPPVESQNNGKILDCKLVVLKMWKMFLFDPQYYSWQ